MISIISSGIRSIHDLTLEARNVLSDSDIVFYLFSDLFSINYIRSISKKSVNLKQFYKSNKKLNETYQNIVDVVMSAASNSVNVSVIFYGHAGVFCKPSHEIKRRAILNNLKFRFLPGISAEDCMVADLGYDPGEGSQVFEASSLLFNQQKLDVNIHNVIYQIGVIEKEEQTYNLHTKYQYLNDFFNYLLSFYPETHLVTNYIASPFYFQTSTIHTFFLKDGFKIENLEKISGNSTLYIPPIQLKPTFFNKASSTIDFNKYIDLCLPNEITHEFKKLDTNFLNYEKITELSLLVNNHQLSEAKRYLLDHYKDLDEDVDEIKLIKKQYNTTFEAIETLKKMI